MKNILFSLLFLCILGLFTNCGSTIKTVVDHNQLKQPYKSSLIVILYDPGVTKHFSEKMKERLEVNIQEDGKKSQFIMVKKNEQKELSLNDRDTVAERIGTAVQKNDIGVVVIFKPIHYTFQNGNIEEVTYQVTAVDVSTKKEVWKAEVKSAGYFGVSGSAGKAADLIYGTLCGDGVI
jgi:hypothetical protein